MLRRWPGYTLASLAEADAHELLTTWQLVTDEHLGETRAESGHDPDERQG